MIRTVVACGLAALLFSSGARATARDVDHVVVVSVDGLGAARREFDPAMIPSLTTLRSGVGTINARTEFHYTLTLPNHTSMITGRPARGEDGHQWAFNSDPPEGVTIHDAAKAYVAGLFDVAHDHGVQTTLIASKTKFSLYQTTWDAAHGAPDETGQDDGPDKIDRYVHSTEADALTTEAIKSVESAIESGQRSMTMVHYRHPDSAGHGAGWDMKPDSFYSKAVVLVDGQLGQLMAALTGDVRLKGQFAIIVTADHGGGAPFRSHTHASSPLNYTIPLLVWFGHDGPSGDLYTLNHDTRADPSEARPSLEDAGLPAIRSGDVANLALDLLGLPPVPGSVYNVQQDLRIAPTTDSD